MDDGISEGRLNQLTVARRKHILYTAPQSKFYYGAAYKRVARAVEREDREHEYRDGVPHTERLSICTDGSYRPKTGRASYSVVWRVGHPEDGHYANSTRVIQGEHMTNVKAELIGLIEGLKQVIRLCGLQARTDSTGVAQLEGSTKVRLVTIYCDCEPAMQAFQNFHCWSLSSQKRCALQHALAQAKHNIQMLADRGIEVEFRWLPAHRELDFNNKADRLARDASSKHPMKQRMTFVVPESYLLAVDPPEGWSRDDHGPVSLGERFHSMLYTFPIDAEAWHDSLELTLTHCILYKDPNGNPSAIEPHNAIRDMSQKGSPTASKANSPIDSSSDEPSSPTPSPFSPSPQLVQLLSPSSTAPSTSFASSIDQGEDTTQSSTPPAELLSNGGRRRRRRRKRARLDLDDEEAEILADEPPTKKLRMQTELDIDDEEDPKKKTEDSTVAHAITITSMASGTLPTANQNHTSMNNNIASMTTNNVPTSSQLSQSASAPTPTAQPQRTRRSYGQRAAAKRIARQARQARQATSS